MQVIGTRVRSKPFQRRTFMPPSFGTSGLSIRRKIPDIPLTRNVFSDRKARKKAP
jgi:hypothetical protein